MKKLIFLMLFCFTLVTVSFAQNECAPGQWTLHAATDNTGTNHKIVCVGISNSAVSIPSLGFGSTAAFPGATTAQRVDNACSFLNGSFGIYYVPNTEPSGPLTVVGIPDNCEVIDNRGKGGYNEFGDFTSFYYGSQYYARWTAAQALPQTNTAIHATCDIDAGGVNTDNTHKSNYGCIFSSVASRTPGQHFGFATNVNNFSDGDVMQLAGTAIGYGNANALGDEGIEGITVQADQGGGTDAAIVASGTVSAINGSTLSFSGTTNAKVLGEKRIIYITTPAKIYSAGTISGCSGTPVVCTGVGTAWATQFGAGAHNDVFLSVDADVISGLKTIIPITNVTDDTHITLDYISRGVQVPWSGSTGTYKIYKGGTNTAVAYGNGSSTLDTVADFSVGDTWEQAVGYSNLVTAAHLTITPRLRSLLNAPHVGAYIANVGTVNADYAIQIAGNWQRAIEINGTLSNFGVIIDHAPPAALYVGCPAAGCNSVTSLIQVNNGTTTDGVNYDFTNKLLQFSIGSYNYSWPNTGIVNFRRMAAIASGFVDPTSADGDTASVRDSTHGVTWFGSDQTCYLQRNGSQMTLASGCPTLGVAGVSSLLTVSSDFTTAANTNLQTITGLSWTVPANTAMTIPFTCHLTYSQATAAVADSFGFQSATVAPTNWMIQGNASTSATARTYGQLTGAGSTTATASVTFTPSATGTLFNADIYGLIEQPSNASTSLQSIMVKTSTAGDAITIKRGSFCRLF